jgi:hypothetical protein
MAFKRLPDRGDELLKLMLQIQARGKARRSRPALADLEIPPEEYYTARPAPEDFAVEEPEEPVERGVGGVEGRGGGVGGKPVAKPLARYSKTKIDTYPSGTAFVEGMVRRGWTPEEAAGAAGNVHVESGFQPAIKSSVPGENSYGLLQWNKDRLTGLQNMAKQTGRDWTDPEVQMDWIDMERSGKSVSYGGGDERSSYRKAFAGGGTPEDIAERFGQFVERPEDLSQTVRQRRQAAAQYAARAMSREKPQTWEEVQQLVMR